MDRHHDSSFGQLAELISQTSGRFSMDDDGTYICDCCGEEIVIPLDVGGGRNQKYVEDCPVCCNPSVIHVEWQDDEARVWAEPEQDRHS